jgi:p-hydroxybenzoate 3-monooxygenase
LYEALLAHYKHNDSTGLDHYSTRALRRVWHSERFSWWMTSLLHRFPGGDPFEAHIHASELEYVFVSQRAQAVLAENYAGLPL